MYEDAVTIIVSILIVGLIATYVVGNPVLLLPCLLAAWAIWQVAKGLNDR